MPTATDTLTTCAHCGHALRRFFGHGFVSHPVTGERVMVCVVDRAGRPDCYSSVVTSAERLGARLSA